MPQIEAKENAPEGLVAQIDQKQLGATLEPGDLVICRKTAPLVKLCASLLIKGVSAKVKGSEIGKELITLVRSVAEQKEFNFDAFTLFLDKTERNQVSKLQNMKATTTQIETFRDRIQAIRSAYRASTSKTIDQFSQELEQLFGETENSVIMCTVHKAKGLEADRVFILEPENLPYLRAGQRDWEVEQENHLKYVALTRAKEELYFIKS